MQITPFISLLYKRKYIAIKCYLLYEYIGTAQTSRHEGISLAEVTYIPCLKLLAEFYLNSRDDFIVSRFKASTGINTVT